MKLEKSLMPKIWITSDLHLNHNKEFIYKARGFGSIEEMNIHIVAKWNTIVQPDDIVYVCGDLILGDLESGLRLIKQLNGRLYIALGNHDTDSRAEAYLSLPNVENVKMGYRIKQGKWSFILSHYPQIVNNYTWDKVYCLCGHSHTKDPFEHFEYGCYHVEMDAHNNEPISLEYIMNELKGAREEKLH